jgi:hypothetical protein
MALLEPREPASLEMAGEEPAGRVCLRLSRVYNSSLAVVEALKNINELDLIVHKIDSPSR